MSISLPHLWILGHFAAPLGAMLLLAQLIWPIRAARSVGILGGILTCAFLGYALHELDQSFFGVYACLSWMIAFFAGYTLFTPVGFVAHWLGRRY